MARLIINAGVAVGFQRSFCPALASAFRSGGLRSWRSADPPERDAGQLAK
jgi:hypothetical protein